MLISTGVSSKAPTAEEKELLYICLCIVALAHDGLHPNEKIQLSQMGDLLNISDAKRLLLMEQAENNHENIFDKKVSSRSMANRIFRDCLLMAYADNNFQSEEKIAIHKIRLMLGISEENGKIIHNWVKEGREWQLKGEKLLEL